MKTSLLTALAALVLSVPAIAAPTIAISDFGTRHDTTLHTVVPNILTENLLNSGRFDFFEREKLNALLAEQNFQSSGMVDPETAMQLGKLSGIDYILTGEIVDFGREVRSFSGYGVRTNTIFYRLAVSVRIIETETGRIIFSKTERAEERQNQGAGIQVIDTTIDERLGSQVADALTGAILYSPAFQEEEEEDDAMVMLEITSEPEKASVEIDGVFYGNTGEQFELTSGVHQIQVSLPGYEIWNKKVMVRDGSSFHVPLVRVADVRVEVKEDKTINKN